MSANYDELIIRLERTERACKEAAEVLTPLLKVKQIDAYILGMLQSARLSIADAKKAAKQAAKVRDTSPKKSNSSHIL